MLISCSEKKDSNNSKENENSDSEKKAIELVGLISKKNQYYIGNPGDMFSYTFLTFEENKVNYKYISKSTMGDLIDEQSISGKYKIKQNEGLYLIEIDFGIREIEVDYFKGYKGQEMVTDTKKLILPNLISAELDSKNNFKLEGWELVLEKEAENKTLSSNSEEETSQKETDEALGGEIEGDIITGIKDKIYFYESSNLDSKTSSYFLKGQKAEYLEISDDDLEDDFLYVNFEYKGKVMTGYVLKSDVKFD